MRVIVAEFRDPETLLDAARRARDAGLRQLDAHVPFSIEELPEALGLPRSPVRPAMLIGGLACGAFAFWLQWYSAVFDYPLNSGGRPLNSWQVFLVPTFEAVIIGAVFAGLLTFLITTALPQLHHPVFAARGFARASQDRFFLSVADPQARAADLAALLDGLGPLSLREVEGE